MNQMQVKTFLSVMRTRNLTVSARELYLSQQAVSKHIIALERELGLTLFIRQKGRMAPTEAALFYSMIFKRWATNYKRVQRETAQLLDELRTQFSIGIAQHIDIFGPFEALLQKFRHLHPNTQFSGCQYATTRLIDMLDCEELDIILLSSCYTLYNNRYSAAPIAHENLCLYTPTWVPGSEIDPACWGLPMYAVSEGTWNYFENNSAVISAGKSKYTFSPLTTVYMPNYQSIQAKLAITPGVVLCDHNFGPMASQKNLRIFPLERESYVLCLWNKKNEHPMITEFIDFMQTLNGISPQSTDHM